MGPFEKHHVIPKSMGGSNKKENLVNLTVRQHFVCHRLLTKMVSGTNVQKAWRALRAMALMDASDQQQRSMLRITSRLFEQLRVVNFAPDSDETRAKKKASAQGRLHSEETKKKMAETRKKRFAEDSTYSANCRAKLLASSVGRVVSEDTKRKISAAGKSRTGTLWILIAPSGDTFQTHRLLQFCESHALDYNALLESGKSGKPVMPRHRHRKDKSEKRINTVGWKLLRNK
jgi:uncharacterized radical SAM superfamily Fe-S cluster-containing enzyme